MDLSSWREQYLGKGLTRSAMLLDPVAQFETWIKQARELNIPEPNAFSLATVDGFGQPHARILLLKQIDSEKRFVFFTNYDSNKGRDMELNPLVSMNFLWLEMSRQVRIEGVVEKVTKTVSETYFSSRPRGSQLGALVSPQSQIIPNRAFLEERLNALEEEYKDLPIPMPEHWGGYAVKPFKFDFWQGQENRLHDRFAYSKNTDEENWTLDRLAP